MSVLWKSCVVGDNCLCDVACEGEERLLGGTCLPLSEDLLEELEIRFADPVRLSCWFTLWKDQVSSSVIYGGKEMLV